MSYVIYWGFFCSSNSHMAHQGQHYKLLNCPEENDETQSEEFHSGLPLASKTSLDHSIPLSRVVEGQTFSHQHNPMSPSLTQSCVKLIQNDQLTRPCQQVFYLNRVDTDRRDQRAHPFYHSRSLGGGQTSSLPSYLPSTENQTYLGAGCVFPSWHHFHPGTHSLSLNSLDQPGSLHSFHATGSTVHTSQVMPLHGLHSGYYGPVPIQVNPQDHLIPRPGYQPPNRLKGIWIQPVKNPWTSIKCKCGVFNKSEYFTASKILCLDSSYIPQILSY